MKPLIFETQEYGQIQVTAEHNNEGRPSIRFSVRAQGCMPEVCSLSMNYNDSETGRKLRDENFLAVDEAWARQIAGKIFREIFGGGL